VKQFPWGEVKSQEDEVQGGNTYYELELDVLNDADYESVVPLLIKYQRFKTERFITLDASKLKYATTDYKQLLAQEITDYLNFGYRYYGQLLGITVDKDYADLRYQPESDSYTTTARYVTTFKGAWTYGEVSDEQIQEALATDSIIYNYVDLV